MELAEPTWHLDGARLSLRGCCSVVLMAGVEEGGMGQRLSDEHGGRILSIQGNYLPGDSETGSSGPGVPHACRAGVCACGDVASVCEHGGIWKWEGGEMQHIRKDSGPLLAAPSATPALTESLHL